MTTWREMTLDGTDDHLEKGGSFEAYANGTKLIVCWSERYRNYVLGGVGAGGSMSTSIGDLMRLMEQYAPLSAWEARDA